MTAGRKILSTSATVGKIGEYAGYAALITAPFTEYNTSANMYKDDIAWLAVNELNQTVVNFELGFAVAGTVSDACSFGELRSAVKTPTTIARLLPGVPTGWADTYDKFINEKVNIKYVYNKLTGVFK